MSVLGAILLTGLLGAATYLRVASHVSTHLLGIYLDLIAWGGLYSRDETVRKMIPLMRRSDWFPIRMLALHMWQRLCMCGV
jgi:hypothetical protein